MAEEENYSNPLTAFFHVLFKGCAIAFYILCSFFINSFIIQFVVTVFLAAIDFWVVKNVSGRILVGLRWWNEINDEGASVWRFESLDQESLERMNKKDSWLFWWTLYLLNFGSEQLAVMKKITYKNTESRRLQNFCLLPLCVVLLLFCSACAAKKSMIGINYGRVANNLPIPKKAVALIQQLKIGRVKMYDTNPCVLCALANTGLEVVVMVKNEELEQIGSSQDLASMWVQYNVVAWHPNVNIITVVVGNKVFSNNSMQPMWGKVVQAMENIHLSLKNSKMPHVKVTTSLALDCLQTSYPPSNGTFNQVITPALIVPILKFLNKTKSPLHIHAYPYYAWAKNPKQSSLDYALFGSKSVVVQDGKLQYANMLEAQLDAVYAAMERLGFNMVSLVISETGWPTKGDANEGGATIDNAALYNNNLIKWALRPKKGTPRRPGLVDIPTYIFALFNENLKEGPETERNWGILYPNGTSVYDFNVVSESSHATVEYSNEAKSNDLQ